MVLQGNVTVAADNYQYAYAYNTFDFTGKGTLSSGGSQSIYGINGVTLLPSGGTMNVSSAGSQTISNNNGAGTVTLGGASADATLNVTAAGSQSISAYNGGLVLQAGSTNGAAVNVSATGSGSQTISSSYGNLLLQGGSADDTAVNVTGSGSQSISTYNSNILLQGGSADRASVTVSKTGAGSQSIDSTYGSISMLGGNTAGTSDASVTVSSAGSQSISTYQYGNGDILLQAGDAHRASVLVSNSGSASQTIAAGRSVTLQGGQGSNAAGGTDSIVSVTTAGNQTIQAATVGSGNLLMQGGSADRNSVSVSMTGSGTQSIVAGRNDDPSPSANVTLQAGNTVGTTGAWVEVVGGGSSQRVYAQGTIAVRGGDGTDAFAAIRSTSGTQDIGDAVYYHSYYGSRNPTDSVVLRGGGGSDSYSLVQAAGRQYVEAQTDVSVQGGAGDGVGGGVGAYARITMAGTGEQRVGTVDYQTLDFCSYSCYYYYRQPLANVAVMGGAVTGTFAKIDTDTVQRVSPSGSLTVQGVGDGAYGLITTGATDQYIGTSSYGNATTQISAGAGAGAYAAIRSSGAQTIDVGNTTLAGSSGDASGVDITAATSQYLTLGSLTMTGGSNRATDAFVKADTGQTIYAGTTSLLGGTGTSSGTASAYIFNDHGSQYLDLGNLTVRSGADYAAASISTLGAGQTLDVGAITLGTTAGTNTLGTSYATIEHLGTGAQTVYANGIAVNNQHATGTVGIMSSGAQSITSNGAVSVQTGAAGDARVTANGAQGITVTGALSVASSSGATALVKATGVQTIGTSGAVTVTASGSGTAAIDAGAGTQEIRGKSALPVNADAGQVASAYPNSANGGVLVQATGAGSTARIENTSGGQSILGSYLYIDTSANGTAKVTGSGNQWVHTTGSGLRVRAMGGGSATLSSGGDQLLQIDYPELMRGAGSGSIIVGDVNAAGSSLIQAVNQDIFAKTISVVGGNVATADAKIDVSGVQNISLVSSSSLTVGNVASVGSSLIDPVTQTILSNGAISVTGGSGTGAVGGIIGTGDQTVLVTSGGGTSISVAGGSGTDAFGQITTIGATQRIGTSGGFTLTGGGGTNADAIIGANGGTAETFLACGSGFTCDAGLAPFTAIPSVNNPFVNGTTDVGVYYSPITVPLDDIIAATGGGVLLESSDFTPPDYLFNSLILWDPTLSLTDEEREEIVLGRRLPVCN
ncbi:MAG: hypothetical protein IPK39_04430 [Sulfuritalea sp.]|nr:hypothetical protein [Sulfuritalea sp.]